MGILGRRIGVRMSKCAEEWMERPEVRRSLERQAAVAELVDAARAAAGTGATDERACAALRERLPADHRLVADATGHLAAERTSYLDDRAYRLLTAAVVPAPVRPIDPDLCELFEAERTLGRCCLTEAFNALADLEPRLRDEALRRWHSRERSARAMREGRRPENEHGRRDLTGVFAEEAADPLLHTELASNVVDEYAIVTHGGRIADENPTPVFERDLHVGCSTVVFGRDTRPRARN